MGCNETTFRSIIKLKTLNMKTKSNQKKVKKVKAIGKDQMKAILGGKRMDPNTGEIVYN